MSAKIHEVRMEIVPDEDPDNASYLEQEGLGFEDRLAAYRNGEFGFVGVQVVAEVRIPLEGDLRPTVRQEIRSPGLWGIEDDSGDDYFREVFEEEISTLRNMLEELGLPAEELSKLNPALIP